MIERFTILLADRNRNIRQFLKRELEGEGYFIKLANNGPEVLKILAADPPDLLVLDLDMTYLGGLEILSRFQNEIKFVPVVVHTLLTAYENHPIIKKNAAAFIEKNGNNINGLKKKIIEVLQRYYPQRFNKLESIN